MPFGPLGMPFRGIKIQITGGAASWSQKHLSDRPSLFLVLSFETGGDAGTSGKVTQTLLGRRQEGLGES